MSSSSNKIALVIGAAGGVGGATAAALARHGWSVRGLTRRGKAVPARPGLLPGSPAMRWNAADVLRAAGA